MAKHSSEGQVPPELSDLHCFTETNGVITTTMFDVPGYRVVKVLGAVYGLTVRSRNWAASLGMVLKSVAGGELRWFTNLVSRHLTASSWPSWRSRVTPSPNRYRKTTALLCPQRRHRPYRV